MCEYKFDQAISRTSLTLWAHWTVIFSAQTKRCVHWQACFHSSHLRAFSWLFPHWLFLALYYITRNQGGWQIRGNRWAKTLHVNAGKVCHPLITVRFFVKCLRFVFWKWKVKRQWDGWYCVIREGCSRMGLQLLSVRDIIISWVWNIKSAAVMSRELSQGRRGTKTHDKRYRASARPMYC